MSSAYRMKITNLLGQFFVHVQPGRQNGRPRRLPNAASVQYKLEGSHLCPHAAAAPCTPATIGTTCSPRHAAVRALTQIFLRCTLAMMASGQDHLTSKSSLLEDGSTSLVSDKRDSTISNFSIRTYLCLRVISLLLDVAALAVVVIAEINGEGSPWICTAIGLSTLFDFIEVAALRATFHGVERSLIWDRMMIVVDVLRVIILIPIAVSIVAPGSKEKYWIAQLVLVLAVM